VGGGVEGMVKVAVVMHAVIYSIGQYITKNVKISVSSTNRYLYEM